MTARPVVTMVSHATRLRGSWEMSASSTPSEIWSASLSGWPMLTDSLVNRCLPTDTCVLLECDWNLVDGMPTRQTPPLAKLLVQTVIINALLRYGQRLDRANRRRT